MRLPTMKQLDNAGPCDAWKLLHSYAEYWGLLGGSRSFANFMHDINKNGGSIAYKRRKAAYNRRHREYFGK